MTTENLPSTDVLSRAVNIVRPIVTPKELVEAHKEFATIIAEVLEEGKDYGTIPGTKTPTLYKPGAERLLASAGCYARYVLVTQETDHNYEVKWRKRKKVWNNAFKGDKSFRWEIEEGESLGLYRYLYKCQIVRKDTEKVIGEGDGSCSTMESKYVEAPRDYENTIVKMATKRALVAAVLGTFGLSNRFTQDMEDIKENERKRSEEDSFQQREEEIYKATDPQKQLLKKYAAEAKAFKENDAPDVKGNICTEISNAVAGVKMSVLKSAVFDYVNTPFKN